MEKAQARATQSALFLVGILRKNSPHAMSPTAIKATAKKRGMVTGRSWGPSKEISMAKAWANRANATKPPIIVTNAARRNVLICVWGLPKGTFTSSELMTNRPDGAVIKADRVPGINAGV